MSDFRKQVLSVEPARYREMGYSLAELAKEKATEQQWYLVDTAIKAFYAKYPLQYEIWRKMTNVDKDPHRPYHLAKEGDLKKANVRHTATFPVILDKEGNPTDSLYPILNRIIPGLTHKKSVNMDEFLRRYPDFNPSYKIGTSKY